MQNIRKNITRINRRQFLRATAISAGTFAMGLATVADEDKDRLSAYGGFKMGLESFSLRQFDMEGCLDRMKKLDLHYIEMFSGHLQVTTEAAKLATIKKTFAKYEVRPFGFFVDNFGKTVDSNRDKFEFARALASKCSSGRRPRRASRVSTVWSRNSASRLPSTITDPVAFTLPSRMSPKLSKADTD